MDGFDFLKRPVEVSEYQWLPSIFYHEYDTDTEIRSYINNLGRNFAEVSNDRSFS